jgi:5-formyltetrahydrofolate cyclo-ligase
MELEARQAASAAVVERLVSLPVFEAADVVLLYAALGAEIDPDALAAAAWQRGKEVRRPASAELPPSWTTVAAPPGVTVGSGAGPNGSRTLVVVPGVAFDATGRRLGRGRGYYDRALAELRRAGAVTAVGVAYELQLVPELPHEPWDEPVDVIVTERRVLRCRTAAADARGVHATVGGTR